MKKDLKLFNDEINVDTQKFLDGKLLLQANTGGGKSWATRRIIEQFAGIVPQIILDPEGEFFTLRQKYPDFILIGKGQAITADPKSAGLLAHKLIEERVSCIIDLLEMKSFERDLFVKNFVQAMINAPRELWLPTLLTIDEAQIFAPESGQSETAAVLKDAGFRFRKRHFGLILATPRISELSKSVASTCKNKLIGQASLDNDMKRSAAEVGFTTKEEVMSLRDLDPGEFYAYGPAFSKKVIKIKIGKTSTQHGDSTLINARVAKPSPKVQKALAVLAEVPQAAEEEAKTISGLQAELRVAKAEIGRLGRGLQSPVIPVDNRKAIERAIAIRDGDWKVLLLKWREIAYALGGAVEKAFKALEPLSEGGEWPDVELPKFTSVTHTPPSPALAGIANGIAKSFERNTIVPSVVSMDYGDMNTGERKILKAIASDPEGITTEHIAVLTGYKGTSRYEYIRKLKARGYIGAVGNVFQATLSGIEALGSDFESMPTGEELRKRIIQELGGSGEGRILSIVIENGYTSINNATSKEEIQELTGYKSTSTYEYLRKLQARKLITVERGMIRASRKLFD